MSKVKFIGVLSENLKYKKVLKGECALRIGSQKLLIEILKNMEVNGKNFHELVSSTQPMAIAVAAEKEMYLMITEMGLSLYEVEKFKDISPSQIEFAEESDFSTTTCMSDFEFTEPSSISVKMKDSVLTISLNVGFEERVLKQVCGGDKERYAEALREFHLDDSMLSEPVKPVCLLLDSEIEYYKAIKSMEEAGYAVRVTPHYNRQEKMWSIVSRVSSGETTITDMVCNSKFVVLSSKVSGNALFVREFGALLSLEERGN